MLEVVRAEYVADYKVRICFNTGEEGIVDLSEALWGPVFEPLRNPEAFRRFEVSDVLHTIRWENDADFAPEFLHDKMIEQKGQKDRLAVVSEDTGKMGRAPGKTETHVPSGATLGRFTTADTILKGAVSRAIGLGCWPQPFRRPANRAGRRGRLAPKSFQLPDRQDPLAAAQSLPCSRSGALSTFCRRGDSASACSWQHRRDHRLMIAPTLDHATTSRSRFRLAASGEIPPIVAQLLRRNDRRCSRPDPAGIGRDEARLALIRRRFKIR